MSDEMSAEGQRVQAILDELIRVTDGLLASKVSFNTVYEYLTETTESMDDTTKNRVLIFAILDILKERAIE